MSKRSVNLPIILLIGIVFLLGLHGISNLNKSVKRSIYKIQEDLTAMQLSTGYLDTLEIIHLKLDELEANISTIADPKVSKAEKQRYLNLPDTIRELNLYCQRLYHQELHQEELFVLTDSRLETWAEILLEVNKFEELESLVGEWVNWEEISQPEQDATDVEDRKISFFKYLFSQRYRDEIRAKLNPEEAKVIEEAEVDTVETVFTQKELDKQVAQVRGVTQEKIGSITELFYQSQEQAHQMDQYIREVRADIQSDALGSQVNQIENTAKTDFTSEFNFFKITLIALGGILFLLLVFLAVNDNKYRKQLQHREEFVSKVSHEIKNSLHPIIGYASNLSKTVTNPDSRRTIWTIKEESQHLLYLANGILDLSKIRASEFKLETAPFILTEALNQVVSSHTVEAEKKGLQLRAKFDPKLPKAVNGDPERLKQVIRNLLGNAIKHTEKGKVTLVASLHKERRGKAHVEFVVSDTGKGLSKRNLRKISRFRRYLSLQDGSRGHGLGLVISHQLVRQHKGSMKIKSKGLGKGVQVFVRIPYEVCGAQEVRLLPQTPVAQPRQLNGKQIMVIDDDPLNLELTQTWFEGWGARVYTAPNGKAAQKLFKLVKADLILVDLHMPELDGVGFVRWLREKRHDSTPVMVCSAGSVGDILEKAKAAGANDFLAKPYNQEELAEKLSVFFSAQPHRFSQPQPMKRQHSSASTPTVYAVEKLQQEFKGNQASIDRKLNLLIGVCKDNLVKIKTGFAQNDSTTINKAVHKMLMLCLYLGKDFVELQAELEEKTKSVYLSSEARSLTQAFVDRVEVELKKLEDYINFANIQK